MNNFIETYMLPNPAVCDSLIALYKRIPVKHTGRTILENGFGIDKEKKDSTEIGFNINSYDNEEINDFLNQLSKLSEKYKEKYQYCDGYGAWGITQNFNIQHYAPGGGYKVWHTERTNHIFPFCTRHLVWMTYLNDVTDAGETEFYYQKLKIQPRKGLTVIWPADWTHTHRGIVSPTQEKYIITGWYNFKEYIESK